MTITPDLAVRRIDPVLTQALESRLLGTLIRPGDDAYEAARHTHDPKWDRYPALIVQAADAADVIRAVEFARQHDLTLAVRGGGHSIPGYSTVDGGLVLDLSGMRAVSVDPARRTAWVQAGATSRDLATRAVQHGLALSTGDTASVGLGGLTLGGGIGFMVRKHGLTIDNLLSVEMVTADGRLIVASAEQHPELFWALRGGGGNFGVVTAFEYQLHPDGNILGGAIVLPATPEVLRGYADYAPYAPDELTTITMLMVAPPLPIIPAVAHGQLVFMVQVAYAGDPAEGQTALAPLRALAEPIVDMIAPMPYPALFQLNEIAEQPHSASVRMGFMESFSDRAIEATLDFLRENPAAFGALQLRALGGAMARVPADATAFAHRDKPFFAAVLSLDMGQGTDATAAWARRFWSVLRPYASGVYVNFLEAEGEERIREAYPPATYARLAAVKRQYDPTNLFRLNQNIKPAE